jgi:two-component sensor histidine kinase
MKIKLFLAVILIQVSLHANALHSRVFFPVIANAIAAKLKYRNPARAMQLVNRVINYKYAKEGIDAARCRAFIIGSLCYENIMKYDSAALYLDSAALLVRRFHDKELMGEYHYAKGILHSGLGEDEQALSEYFKAAGLCVRHTNQSMIYNDIGRQYRMLENDSAALTYFQRSYEIGLRNGDSVRVAAAMNNLGSIYRSRKAFDRALVCYDRSYAIRRMSNDTGGMISTLINKAIVLDKLGQSEVAVTLMEAALPVAARRKMYVDEVTMKSNLGLYCLHQGQTDKAAKLLESGFVQAQQHKLFDLGKRIGLVLSEMYAKKGDYKKAHEYYKQYSNFQNSLVKEKQVQNAQIFDVRFRMKENEQKIKRLSEEQVTASLKVAMQQDKISRQRISLLLAGVILLLVVTLLLVIFRRNRLQQKLNVRLEELIKQKELLMSEIHHRVKNNLQLVASLLHLQAATNNSSGSEALRKSEDRIHTLALLHEKLYQSESLSGISLRDYVQQLTNDLMLSLCNEQKQIKLVCDVDDVNCDVDQLVPCGLIINELVTNSIKHAFTPGYSGEIAVKANLEKGQIKLQVEDNGRGISTEQEKAFSLGMRLVKGLVKQLKGSLIFLNHTGPGFAVEINFPLTNSTR